MRFTPNAYTAYINSKEWKQSNRRKIAFDLLIGQDIVFPLLKAHDVEHLSYKRIDFENCKGYEIPFLDLLPLNRAIHRQIVTPVKDILRWLRLAEGNAIRQKDRQCDRCKLSQSLPVVLVCRCPKFAFTVDPLSLHIQSAHSSGIYPCLPTALLCLVRSNSTARKTDYSLNCATAQLLTISQTYAPRGLQEI